MTLQYFSACSGIGGFELGIERAAEQLGFTAECVGYAEIDEPAIRTYKEHYTHDNFGDISTVPTGTIPRFDLFVAGFPCQPFSIAGGRRGFEDTRGTLFFDIARIIKAHEPQNFILENVKGLLSHDQGNTFRVIIATLDELGYDVQWKVLNSKDHGVPQNRERVYIVGNLGGTPRPEVFTATGSSNPYSTVGFTTETAVARTLTAGGNSGGNHSGMTILRTPQGDRRLTPVEWERLQGFPDGWTVGSDTQRYKQLGNAVTVNVVRDVVSSLYRNERHVLA